MPRTSILKLAKSGGAVKREGEERRGAREARVRDYFYGAPGAPLQPATMTVKATDLAVYRIGGQGRLLLCVTVCEDVGEGKLSECVCANGDEAVTIYVYAVCEPLSCFHLSLQAAGRARPTPRFPSAP